MVHTRAASRANEPCATKVAPTKPTTMNPHIFREYDIRGAADRDLDEGLVRALGRAFGTFQRRAGSRRIALGRDCRVSSPRLHAALTEGMTETGIDLVDLGMVPTPLMYFAVHHFDLDGGVQITGSHNPPGDNGFKMMKGKGTLFGHEIQQLRQMIEKEDFDHAAKGSVEHTDPVPSYAGYMKGNVELTRTDIPFAVDAGNGAGGPAALAAMDAVGLKPITLLCEPDGEFPVHHPDPSEPENLELLRSTVHEKKLALGIAYDGDADRIGVINEKGDVYSSVTRCSSSSGVRFSRIDPALRSSARSSAHKRCTTKSRKPADDRSSGRPDTR